VVVGISTDTLDQQQKFTEKNNLNFPLLADDKGEVARAFGVLPPGAKFARRSTFVIDKEGRVAKTYPAVGNAVGHPEEVLTFVKENLAKKN